MSHPSFRLLAALLLSLLVLPPGTAAAGGREGGLGAGGAYRSGPPAKDVSSPPLPVDAMRASASQLDIAVLPIAATVRPAVLREVEREIAGLLGRKGLRVAHPRRVRAALSGAAAGPAGSGDQPGVLVRALGCRYVLRISVTHLSSERSIVGGALLGPVMQLLIGGSIVELQKSVMPDVDLSTGAVVGILAGAALTLGSSLNARVAVECTVLDGEKGSVVWTGEQLAEGERWIFGILASRDRLLARILTAAVRKAILNPISMAKMRERAAYDDFREAVDTAVKRDPWAGVATSSLRPPQAMKPGL